MKTNNVSLNKYKYSPYPFTNRLVIAILRKWCFECIHYLFVDDDDDVAVAVAVVWLVMVVLMVMPSLVRGI